MFQKYLTSLLDLFSISTWLTILFPRSGRNTTLHDILALYVSSAQGIQVVQLGKLSQLKQTVSENKNTIAKRVYTLYAINVCDKAITTPLVLSLFI